MVAHHHADFTPILYIIGAIFVLGMYFGCLHFIGEVFPRGPRLFDPVELDDIRIGYIRAKVSLASVYLVLDSERLDDIESSLRSNIQTLTDKLTFHRQKKTALLADRDLRIKLEDRQERMRFDDSKGRSIYGEAWDGSSSKDISSVSVKDVLMLTRNEVEEIKKEAEEIVKKRQKEEKRDLWELWDKIGKDTTESSPQEFHNKRNTSYRETPNYPITRNDNTNSNKRYILDNTVNAMSSSSKDYLNEQELKPLITQSESFSTPRGQNAPSTGQKRTISKAPSHIKPPPLPPAIALKYPPLGSNNAAPYKIGISEPSFTHSDIPAPRIARPAPPLGPPPGYKQHQQQAIIESSKNKRL